MVSTGVGVRRGLERRAAGGVVALVALALLAQHVVDVAAELLRRGGARARSGSACRKTLTAASGATTVRDVAALGDPVAVGHDRLLLGDERGAHRGVGRDPRGGLGDLGRADRVGDVAAVEQHAVADLDVDPLGDLPAGSPVSRAASPTQRYIAPVSRYVKPSRSATARATVDLPAPAGPSMAMTMTAEASSSVSALTCSGCGDARAEQRVRDRRAARWCRSGTTPAQASSA